MAIKGQTKTKMTITRTFDAPRELVWRAWSEPELFKQWWGPREFTTPVAEIDFRVGGRSLSCMRSPEGQDFWSTGVYKEIVEPKKIVVTDSFSDEKGNVVPASHYGMQGDWPLELLVTVSFEEQKGRTKMTLIHEGLPEGENMEMARQGWEESFDKMEELLERNK